MDVAFGFVGKDFSIVVTDCGVPRSIVVMKQFEDKIVKVAPKSVFAVSGEVSDRNNFSDYIQKNIKWFEMRNGRELTNHAIANFTRCACVSVREPIAQRSENSIDFATARFRCFCHG